MLRGGRGSSSKLSGNNNPSGIKNYSKTFTKSSLTQAQQQQFEQFESTRFNMNHEEMFVIFADGTSNSVVGNSGSVSTKTHKNRVDSVSVHNHPVSHRSNSHLIFSDGDISDFLYSGEKEMRMITEDRKTGQKIVSRLIRNVNFDYSMQSMNNRSAFLKAYKKDISSTKRRATRQYNKTGNSADLYAEWNRSIPNIIGNLHNIAKQYGYTYIREKL